MYAVNWFAAAIAGLSLLGAGAAAAPGASHTLSGLVGDWDGTLDAGALKLRLTLHVHAKDGAVTATLDSPDQGAKGLPATLTLLDGRLRVAAQGVTGQFDLLPSADGSGLAGEMSGRPVSFTRRPPGAAPPTPNRPQTPVKPYPYREQEVIFANSAAQVKLAGALTTPPGRGPFPTVVLIAGSGAHDRDEAIFGHAFFLVLADHLTRSGIAVLRYDKRGVGRSGGDIATATSADFAADAEAAVAFLKGRPEVGRIGLIGHSEGGLIAPLVAERAPSVGFIVLLAGPGVSGDRIIMAQSQKIAQAAGAPAATLAANAVLERRFLDAVMAAKDGPSAEQAARKVLEAAGAPAEVAATQARAAASDWYRFYLRYDPAPALNRLRLPVLAVIGSKDLQVPADENLPALRNALANDPEATVEEIPGLNHLFQTARTGAPAEYGEIEETLSPLVLDLVTDWILEQPEGR